ncbi:MAG: glucan biosynthesis protein [Rubellimicrobium sp.]|nr:glucan biosynthesis protein [Rubellimicrobium sp.]
MQDQGRPQRTDTRRAGPTRRELATSLAVFALAAGLRPGAPRAEGEGTSFSFDGLTDEMRARAATPDSPAEAPEGFWSELDYDAYRLIRFRTERARWQGPDAPFHLHAFHMGWLFPEPVQLHEVRDGIARKIVFTAEDFEYLGALAEKVPGGIELPGVAGFRLNHPLNRPDRHDELVAFLGASYFRALGRGSAYGISARGLAVNTARGLAEEFPRFSRFWIERDPGGGPVVTVHAAMESASLTGAFRLVIRPGTDTVMDVTARLFFRQDVEEIGVAPLTSMFLFSDVNRGDFDDYRPQVHDSDGLMIERANGDVIWRPLNNPARLATSYFAEDSPRAFGLFQRDRLFANHQDPGARYDRRPSLKVEPAGDWGPGAVRLVEIPTALEVTDNIVAFWVPQEPVRAGAALQFGYRLVWGDLPPDPAAALAHVVRSAAGAGGVSGVEPVPGTRKFVVDFAGGIIADLPGDAGITPVVGVSGGDVTGVTLERIEGQAIWRVVIDAAVTERSDGGDGLPDVVELSLHLAGYGRKLSEDWLFQWVVS